MREVTVSAPGKVNLILDVGAPTADGYHPLLTVFEALNIREYVTVRTSRSPGIRVTTRAYHPDGRVDEALSDELCDLPVKTHLAARAAKAMQRLAAAGPWAATSAGVSIHVEKHIPVAGGMAGGSADAAATLVACNELWELGLTVEQLEALGRTLGADVPACLRGGVSVGTGRGDHMRPLGSFDAATHHWVMAFAHEGLSTPAVFSALDEAGGPEGGWRELGEAEESWAERLTGPAENMVGLLRNDLQNTAFSLRPELYQTWSAAKEGGALEALVSGSGPTIAALCSTSDHARALAEGLRTLPSVRDVLVTSGPAPGARLESSEEVN
ncbi:MAG: 4-(cytidine 5'-diphospho)-2-C-methyl-D-erythritol kinase [Actinobacteria bacterium]|nr:MAG: 4-(cytidine 5'-diphospho)-2-C-methyl-D-erythritol kinase [Actinomycetota bacterium]